MIPRAIRRRIRPMWLAAVASAAWANRHDVRRWADFAADAVRERSTRPIDDVVTEAKVRAAVTMDPVLRRDPSLRDVIVRDGVVTVVADRADWPSMGTHISRLARVKGVTTVESAIPGPGPTSDPVVARRLEGVAA
jgi:hypothetical protein